jgi:hypothetical protein
MQDLPALLLSAGIIGMHSHTKLRVCSDSSCQAVSALGSPESAAACWSEVEGRPL